MMQQEIALIFPDYKKLDRKNCYQEGIAVSKLKIKGDDQAFDMSTVETRRMMKRRDAEQKELINFFIRNYEKPGDVKDVLYKTTNKTETSDLKFLGKESFIVGSPDVDTKNTPVNMKMVTNEMRQETKMGHSVFKEDQINEGDYKGDPSDSNEGINKDLPSKNGSNRGIKKINQVHGLGTISEEKDQVQSGMDLGSQKLPGLNIGLVSAKTLKSNGTNKDGFAPLPYDYDKLKGMNKSQLLGLKRQSTIQE